jgi:hypothetical protein
MSEDKTSIVRYDRLPPEWRATNVGIEAMRTTTSAMANVGIHGVCAGLPIICRGKKCPYLETCSADALGLNVEELCAARQRCPVEIYEIVSLFNSYANQFAIDETCEDRALLGLVKELVDCEVQIKRADHVIAQQGDFLENVVVGISDSGEAIMNKQISKPIEYKERILEKKHKILQLLNATPKDKAGSKLNVTIDPSTYASQLIAKANELRDAEIIDLEQVEGDDNG